MSTTLDAAMRRMLPNGAKNGGTEYMKQKRKAKSETKTFWVIRDFRDVVVMWCLHRPSLVLSRQFKQRGYVTKRETWRRVK